MSNKLCCNSPSVTLQRKGRTTMWHYEEEEAPEYEEGKTDYTNRQLELMADEMLRSDSRAEMCRICKERGEETGKARTEQQFGEDGQPIADDLGGFLYL